MVAHGMSSVARVAPGAALPASLRGCVLTCGCMLLTPAVSQEKPAPSVAPAPAVVAPSASQTPAPTPPSTSAATPSPTPSATQARSKAEDAPAAAAKADAKSEAKVIALVLPLASKTLGKASEALRDGFLAGAAQSNKDRFVARVYLAEDEAASAGALYRKAVKENVVAIVGGLTRDGAAAVAREASYLPTLALNQPSEATNLEANNFYFVSLSFDIDARLAARAAFEAGLRNAVIVHGPSVLAKRIQDVFEKEWARLGGSMKARVPFSGLLDDGAKLRAALEKPEIATADVVFLAAEREVARFARPFLLQGVPVYATAQSVDPTAGAVENLDLEAVRYLELPWFVERDHAAVMTYARPTEALPNAYERLYALGIDAWRIVEALLDAEASGNKGASPTARSPGKRSFAPIDGVTGRITLDSNQFVRALPLVEIRDGRAQVIKPVE
jgi:uncharacterized protein